MSKSIPQPIFIQGVVIKDERGKLKNCQLCGLKFSLGNSEHQCKRCKRAVCEKCAVYKAIVQKMDQQSKKPHRQCNFCKEESDAIRQFVEQYKIAFNSDTFSVQWLASYGSSQEKAAEDFINAIDESKSVGDTNEFDVLKAKLDVILQDIECFVNYSLKDFLLQALRNIDQNKQKDIIKNSLLRVVGTFLLLYPEVGFSAELVLIAYFLMCFSKEASAYILLTIIYGHIIPSYLYAKQLQTNKYNYLNEVAMISGVCKDVFQLPKTDLPIIENLMKEKLKRYTSQLGINLLLFETTFFIVNQIFEVPNEGYADLLKLLAITCSLSNKEIQINKTQYDQCDMIIMRGVRAQPMTLAFKQTQKCLLENYRKEEVVMRSSSINTRSLSLAQDKPSASQIQYELSNITEQNKKLTQKLADKDVQIQELEYCVKDSDGRERELKEQNDLLKESIEKFQHQVETLQTELTVYRDNGNVVTQDDSRLEMLLKQNKTLQLKLEQKEIQVQELLSGDSVKEYQNQKKVLEDAIALLETKNYEQNMDKEKLAKEIEQQKISNEKLQREIEERKATILTMETKLIESDQLCAQLQKKADNMQFELSLNQSFKASEGYEQVFKVEMEKINTEFEKQGLLVNELNARKYQLEREVSEQQKIIEQEVEKQREITLVFEQQIAQLEERRLQQDQALKQLKQEFSEKVQEYEEQISLLQLADERNHRKLEQQSQVVEQLAELQIAKQSLDKQIKKYLNEIEQLKSQLESNKEPADTGSMEYQNSITQQLQAKNEEISLLGDLNSELVMKSEELENRIKDLEIQVNNQQKALKLKNNQQGLLEQNQELQGQLEEQRQTQMELLEQLNQIPQSKPQLFEFSDSNKITTQAKDQEDAKNVFEIKSFQNQILKGLLKENQQQIQQLTQTLLSFKSILTRPPRFSVSY